MIRLLGLLVVGVACMYFLDPVSGKRRRALMRDKMTHYRKEARAVRRRLGERRPASAVDIDLTQQK